MDQETLMERLRNPKKFRQHVQQTASKEQQTVVKQVQKKKSRLPFFVGIGVTGLALVSLLFLMSAQNRAENISSFLDPTVLKGLTVNQSFNPNTGKKYVQVSEGAERNVAVRALGSTLPVISRYNFRALTKDNYEVMGAAPWALSINVTSNIEDPDLLRYLFNQDDMIKSFLARKDVAPYLADAQTLAQLAGNEQALEAFFNEDAAKQVLASPKVIEALAGSRFFAYLLISKAAKFYRENPEQAAQLIAASPTLSELKKNEAVRKAVEDNVYLKNIAPTLLK